MACARCGEIKCRHVFAVHRPDQSIPDRHAGRGRRCLCRIGDLHVRAQRQGRARAGHQQADLADPGPSVRKGRAQPGRPSNWPSGRCSTAARSRPSVASCCTSRSTRRVAITTSTLVVPGGLEMTTSRDVLEALSNGAGPQARAGHAGLQRLGGRANLEEELGRNGWLTVTAAPRDHLRHPDRTALRAGAGPAGR